MVSNDSMVPAPGQPDEREELATAVSTLEIAADQQQEVDAPHRSHDPQFNQKRSDPFQFGSRFLEQEDDVFAFNAWDHVETDDAYKEYSEQQFAMQRQAPVSDFDKCKLYFIFFLLPGFHDDFLFYKHSSSEFTLKTNMYCKCLSLPSDETNPIYILYPFASLMQLLTRTNRSF